MEIGKPERIIVVEPEPIYVTPGPIEVEPEPRRIEEPEPEKVLVPV